MEEPGPENGFQPGHANLLLTSFRHHLGRDLIAPDGSDEEQARALWTAPFAVLSHSNGDDPVLTYINRFAIELWEADWATLTSMPSRKTAEPMHRDQRAAFLKATREKGFVSGYAGIRISARGRRFEIRDAIIWNLMTHDGTVAGQAATFSEFTFL